MESISSRITEIEFLGDLFVVDVLEFAAIKGVSIIGILWGHGFAEVRVQQARVVVTVEATGKAIDIVFVTECVCLHEEGEQLRSTHPAEALFVDHGVGIHEVKVSLLNQFLFLLFEHFLVLNHVEKKLN